jgi:hypothetical protein
MLKDAAEHRRQVTRFYRVQQAPDLVITRDFLDPKEALGIAVALTPFWISLVGQK